MRTAASWSRRGGGVSRTGLVVALTTVFILTIALSAGAEPQWQALLEPSGRTELAVGTLTAFAGGWIGLWGMYYTLLWIYESRGMGYEDAAFSAAMNANFVGYPLGAAIGASLGVIGTGWALKDEGNELLAFLGSGVGFVASCYIFGMSYYAIASIGPSWLELLFVSGIGAAAGATIGYHYKI